MADYAIGDVQGCFEPLMRLLDYIQFNEKEDRLWFVGDLVNRGPQSLEVLRFIKNLSIKSPITLGNHDLHLLNKLFGSHPWEGPDDTLDAILKAEDSEELGHWLRNQSILYHDTDLNIVMCHAGIAPSWDLSSAKSYAKELEKVLQGPDFKSFLDEMYGNYPNFFNENLQGIERLRAITNYFTRMRFCDAKGDLLLTFKGPPEKAMQSMLPWFKVPHRIVIKEDIVFGHWAALGGLTPVKGIYAIDTGCIWGNQLTALRLQDRQVFSVKGMV